MGSTTEQDRSGLDTFLTLDEAALHAGMTPLALSRAVRSGRLPSIWWPHEHRWYVTRRDLEHYLARRGSRGA